MKAIVISKPKSGTFLLGNIIDLMGMDYRGIFVKEGERHQYDPKNTSKKFPIGTTMGLTESLSMVRDNEVVLSHLLPNHTTKVLLKDFKKIIIDRDEKERERSFAKWSSFLWGKEDPYPTERFASIDFWLEEPNSFGLNFNDIINKNVVVIDALQIFILGEVKYNSKLLCQKALEMDSLTKMR
jgi:hypothetical protein